MARRPRFLLPGQPHLIEQRGHNRAPIVHDDEDRARWLHMLRDAAAAHRVILHAWGLADTGFAVVAVPADGEALARMMQTLGRRYVASFNARHGRSGTLFDGRFRVCLVEPGEALLSVMVHVESAAPPSGPWSSARHHVGDAVDPALSDPTAYWSLGNTPFDRQSAWRRRLEAGLPAATVEAISRALRGGRPLGSTPWVQALQQAHGTPLVPRPRGRPPRTPAT